MFDLKGLKGGDSRYIYIFMWITASGNKILIKCMYKDWSSVDQFIKGLKEV